MRAIPGTGSREPAAHFAGFPPDTLRYLRDLRENNEKPWFEAHRSEYERLYVAPARAFVTAAGEVLAGLAPGIRAEPRILGSIFRINRDTRFGADRRPYKDHIDFWFWEGERAGAVSGFFLRLSPDFVGLGAGSHGFDRGQLERFRKALTRADTASELTAVASSLEAGGNLLAGEHFARTPRGYDPASPGPRHCCGTGRSSSTGISRSKRRSTAAGCSPAAAGTGHPWHLSIAGWSATCRLPADRRVISLSPACRTACRGRDSEPRS